MKLEQNKKNFNQYLNKTILKIKKINMTETIVIVGTPRSGTTWLMELLGTIPSYTYLFEPLNPRWFPESSKIGFQSKTYLPDSADWTKGEKYLRKAFTGRLFSIGGPYELRLSKPKMILQSLLYDKLIVKSVRMNRLLPWVAKRFELRNIFYIIRHPCAVVASQLKTGFTGHQPINPPYINITPNPKNILSEASKIEGLSHNILDKLKKIEKPEEILAVSWCLDNYVPLSLPKPHPWTMVIYEKLINEGEKEIIRLFNEIGEKDRSIRAIRFLKKPSKLTQKSELNIVKNEDKQLSKWKKSLSEKQIDRILKIVDDFGLDFYTENIEPDYQKIKTKLRSDRFDVY